MMLTGIVNYRPTGAKYVTFPNIDKTQLPRYRPQVLPSIEPLIIAEWKIKLFYVKHRPHERQQPCHERTEQVAGK